MEKYDTLLAHELAKSNSDEKEILRTLGTRGAALWEADPANQHNRAEVRCSGSQGKRDLVRRKIKESLGDIDQVEVGGGSGTSLEILYQGQNYPVVEVRKGSSRGTDYIFYIYDQDVSYFLEAGAPPLPDRARSRSRHAGGKNLAEGVFSRIEKSDNPSLVGTWGHGQYEFNGIGWRRDYQKNIQAEVGRSPGKSSTLRWGRDLEHRVDGARYRVENFDREESETQSGRLPGPEDEWVMLRRYEIDIYAYDSGVRLPGTRPGEPGKFAENKLILFPSRRMRRELKSRGKPLPEGAGWEHHYWVEKGSKKGVSWSGHCAGFSAASVLFKEPPARKTIKLSNAVRPVRLKASFASEACREKLYYESFGEPTRTITFNNRDLKGLAVELGQSVEVGFEHPVRESTDREIPGVKVDYPVGAAGRWADLGSSQESWDDIKAHNLHIILLDFIKQRKQGLVMDRHPCEPVWNSPVWGYDFTVVGNKAKKRYEVTAQIYYTGYGRSYGDGVKASDTRGTQIKVYPRDGVAPYAGDAVGRLIKGEALEFWLHVDKDNRVTGSEWRGKKISCTDYKRDSSGRVTSQAKASRKVAIHPDAIWVPTHLAASTRSSRGRVNRNPRLEEELLFKTYPVLTSERGESYLHSWAR
jgi:hypothetical protein